MKRILLIVCLGIIITVVAVDRAAAYEGAVYLTNSKITVETNDDLLIAALKSNSWIEIVKKQGFVIRDVSVFHSSSEILVYPMDERVRDKKGMVKYKPEDQYLPAILVILGEISKIKEQSKNK